LQPIVDYPLTNLEELRLDWAKANGRLVFSPRRKLTPRLRRLDVSGVILEKADLPPSLEYLRIHESSFVEGPFLDEDAVYLPRLASLVLSDTRFITFEMLELLLGTIKVPLRVLHVDCCLDLNGPALVRFNASTSKLDSLQDFNVSNVLQINDMVVGQLTSRMSELKILNVSYTMVTGCTIKNLADCRLSPDPNVIKIARICARGCEELSSDAVAYGRARGVEIFT
jgi:F-box/TPR repeat protein Pof3